MNDFVQIGEYSRDKFRNEKANYDDNKLLQFDTMEHP